MTDEPEDLLDGVTDEELLEEITLLRDLLSQLPAPTYPLSADWGVSIADLVALRWTVPKPLRRVLRMLDRFGAVRLTPEGVGLDHRQVDWDDLLEIRMMSLWIALQEEAVNQTVEQVAVFLPPVPGRRWLLRRLAALVVALAGGFLPEDPETSPFVPAQLLRRGRFGREVEVSGGLVTTVLLYAVPQATEVLLHTAEVRGIPVVHPAP